MRIEHDVEMKMRDGVTLRANVIRPDIRGKVPAILLRTPYDKDSRLFYRLCPERLAAMEGFAVVVQDVRGRFASEGQWDFVRMREREANDGYDSVEWLAAESWCSGRVGMMGGSASGGFQLMAAAANPPSLRCIAPALQGMGLERWRTQRMHLESILVGYLAGLAADVLDRQIAHGTADPEDVETVMAVLRDPKQAASVLPLDALVSLNTPGMPSFRSVYDVMEDLAPGGDSGEQGIHVPALWVSGWYDNSGGGELFQSMRANAATRVAREKTRLILGPWAHNYHDSYVGEMGLGAFASAEGAGIPGAHISFFSRHLRDDDVDLPVVRYFVMGTREWKEASDWPLPTTEWRPMYLRSGGHANSATGDGRLTWGSPPAGEREDHYRYDPHDPVPSWGFRVMYTGGSTLPGPFDQNRVESRSDVLVYTSEPMSSALEIVGDVETVLYAASSAFDTDFIVKLCDVDVSGISLNLADGYIRARYREHWNQVQLLHPGEVVRYRVLLGPVGHVFLPGHRIRVQVTSSAFPHYDRNMNTGGPIGAETTGIVAEQAVSHSDEYPSHILLPVQL